MVKRKAALLYAMESESASMLISEILLFPCTHPPHVTHPKPLLRPTLHCTHPRRDTFTHPNTRHTFTLPKSPVGQM